MAIRLKTVEYWFPMLATAVDNTDTNLAQITINLPETRPATPFVTALLEVQAHDRNTTLGNVSRRQLSMSIAGSAYTVVNNTNALTNGGEQQNIIAVADFTGLFNANFASQTSRTVDARVLFDSAVATPLNPAWSNISAKLTLTYLYDDTSATQIKTVYVPLDAPTAALGTSQGTAADTIPALDNYLPEASKVYRQQVVVVQGNDGYSGTTDLTFSHRVGTGTTYTSQAYEKASNVANWYRNHSIETFDTSTTHDFFLWGSVAARNHQQAYLVVTYEFDATAANRWMVSLLVPMEMDSPMGGPTSADYQRASRDLWIQEANPTAARIAAMVFWDQLGSIANLNLRVGSGSFIAYADSAAVLAGSNAAMIRNDAAFTFARGRNVVNVDAYRTDVNDVGYNVGCLWLINYTCDKPAAGYGACNKTVQIVIKDHGTTAASVQSLTSSSVTLPVDETGAFFNAIGIEYKYLPSGTIAVSGCAISAERLAGEGGPQWDQIYADVGGTDGETGVYHAYATARSVFRRWPGDTVDGNDRLDIGTTRRIRTVTANSVSTFDSLMYLLTYHTFTYACADSVSGFSGTVTISLHRPSGEKLKETTRSGDGAFSLEWYDNTEPLYVQATDGTAVGRSQLTLAS